MEFLKNIEDYKEDLIEAVQASVRIRSVEEDAIKNMPFGLGPYKALENILELGESLGFKSKNLDGYAGHIDFGEGDKTLGILGHVDVVPEGNGWTYPAYGGEIHDGKIYGRGTMDDKGPTIAALFAMKILKDSGVKLNKKVRMIVGANEETDWRCMDYYFKHEKAPDLAFTPDASFPVIYAEKGSMTVNLRAKIDDENLVELKAGAASNVVPENARVKLKLNNIEKNLAILEKFKEEYDFTYEVNAFDFTLETKGTTAHGSRPELGISALNILFKLLGEMELTSGDFKDFVDFYNERIGFFHNGEKLGCGFEDDVVGKLTTNPGLIKYEDGFIILNIDIRYPVKNTSKDVFKGIEENLRDTNVEVILESDSMKPLYVEKDSFLVEKLTSVYREVTGEDLEPTTIGGATYARVMENAVAFGPMFPGMKDLAHQKDEHIAIDHLMKLLEIYTRAIYELAK